MIDLLILKIIKIWNFLIAKGNQMHKHDTDYQIVRYLHKNKLKWKVDFSQIYRKTETDRNQEFNSHFIRILFMSLFKKLSVIFNCSNISTNCGNYLHFWLSAELWVGCCQSFRVKIDRVWSGRNRKDINGRFTMEEHDCFCCWIFYLKCFSCLE